MNSEMIEKILKMSDKKTQIEKAHEELHELSDALQTEDVDNIAEEIADVLIVTTELMYIYELPIDYIEAIIGYKLNRTINRLEREGK